MFRGIPRSQYGFGVRKSEDTSLIAGGTLSDLLKSSHISDMHPLVLEKRHDPCTVDIGSYPRNNSSPHLYVHWIR